jgi:uncharacterized Zn finger protein
MQIPLDQFEQVIDEKILKRGLSYYKKGLVQQLDEVSPNTYEAMVEGTEDYTVQLTVKNNVVTEYVCDCPYDQGPVCKHVAAVIFKLQEDQLQLNPKQTKTKSKAASKTATGKKRKTIAEQINEMLTKASKEELVALIQEEASSNTAFRNRIMMALEQYNDNISKDFYAKQMKAILKSAKGRYGFVDWQSARVMGRSIEQMLNAAYNAYEHDNYQNAMLVSFAAMEVLIPALNEIDDSSGVLTDCITMAYDLLRDMGTEVGTESIRKEIFDFCFNHLEKHTFSGWDWHVDSMWLAMAVARTKKEYDSLLSLVEQEQDHEPKGYSEEFEQRQLQLIKYRILEKTRGDEAANAYLKQKLDNPELRRVAIKNAIMQKEFDAAIKLAMDGVKKDMKQYPGLAKEWYDWLLTIALAQNDTPKIIEYARYLLIDNFQSQQDYYQILKQHVKPDQWTEFVDQLIHDIEAKSRGYHTDLVAKILIKEARWDQLWNLVCGLPFLQSVEYYESYFTQRHPDQLAELYAKRILDYMSHNMGRDHYQTACRYIRKIIKLGERQVANDLIDTLRKTYPQRRALLEELNKV